MGSCGTKTQPEVRYTENRSSFDRKLLKSTTACTGPYSTDLPVEHPEQSNGPNLDQKQKQFLFKFKKYDAALLREEFIDDTTCSVLSCKCIKRIVLLLKYYLFLEKHYLIINEFHDKLLEYFDTKYFHLISDYHHIISYHLNQKNNIQFELVYNEITKYISCNNVSIAECRHFMRNNAYSLDCVYSEEISFYLQLIDSIHCFFLHSYDDGFRIKSSEMYDIGDSYNDNYNAKNELFYDKEMRQLKAYLINLNSKIPSNIKYIFKDRMQVNKFHTNHTDQNVMKCDLQSINEEEEAIRDCKMEQMEQYCQYKNDHTFYYWDYYRNLKVYDNDTGDKCSKWYIERKYNNLKDEILNNKIYCLNHKLYDNMMNKATNLFIKSNQIKSIYSNKNMHYEIDNGQSINVSNILSLILYTDRPLFSYHFKSTFRRINAKETINELKARNSEFWFLSRVLRETVECYKYAKQTVNIGKLYTSVSFALFSSFKAKFIGITSMTPQISVITNYSMNDNHNYNKGIILELNATLSNEFESNGSLKYFDCSMLSRFGNESEILFFGGNAPLKFSSIKIIKNNQDFACFIKAIEIFIDIINGKFNRNVSDSDYFVIDNLCKYQSEKINNCFPHYINQTFMNLCNSKSNIHIDLYNLNKYHYELTPSLLHSKCTNLVLFDYICLIFPHCQTIAIDDGGTLSMHYFSSLLQIIRKLNHLTDKICKIKTIEIRTVTVDYTEYKSNDIESTFANKNWLLEIENHSFEANTGNIITDLLLTKQT